MPTMNVAQFAIKLGLDPSSIPADLQKVVVNLTSAQRRLAQQQALLQKEGMRQSAAWAENAARDAEKVRDAQVAAARAASEALREQAEIQKEGMRQSAAWADNAAHDAEKLEQAEMAKKRAGFASIMLASNMAGAGIPFPLARILSQQFPGITQMLSGIIGLTAAGVGLRVIVDIFDKISHKLEEAKQKEEAYAEAVRKTKTVLAESLAENERNIRGQQARLAGMAGDGTAEFRFKISEIGAESLDRLAKQVDALTEAEIRETKAAAERMQVWAAIQRFTHASFTGESELGLEKIADDIKAFQEKFADLAREDALAGTTKAAEALNAELLAAQAISDAMQKQWADQEAHPQFAYTGPGAAPGGVKPRISKEEVDARAQRVQYLKDQAELERQAGNRADLGAKTAGVEEIKSQFTELARTDALHHTKESAMLIQDKVAAARADLVLLQSAAKPDKDRIANQKQYIDALARIPRDKKDEAGDERARQVREEIASIQKLMATSSAAAGAEEVLAGATDKGTAASIRNAAAAEAQKRILDAIAESRSKLDPSGRSIGDDKGVQSKLAEYAVEERKNALVEQTAKATGELNKQIAELNTRTDEHVSSLNEEASGHNKVSIEQAKNLERLIPLEQRLQGLKDLYASLPAADKVAPVVGRPTVGQAFAQKTAGDIAHTGSGLDALRGKIGGENAQIQAAAFAEELKKVKERTAEIAGAGVSPWAKINAEVAAATERMRGLGQSETEVADQAKQLRAALSGEQHSKIGAEFDKLTEKARETRVELGALASGSPFAKSIAEAEKLGHEMGMTAFEISLVRQRLIELQAMQNASKAWEGADALSASGSKMYELQQQMATLRSAATTGKVRDDSGAESTLSPDALAAVRLRMQELTEEEDKLLLKTGGINDGFQAWLHSLDMVESEGTTVFNALTQATKGFESTAADSLVKILETHAGQHQKLIHQLRQMWESFFAGLAKMAIQRGLQGLLAPIAGAIAKKPQSAAGTVDLGAGSAEQFAKGPGALFSGLGKAGGAGVAALPANTTAITANTTALGANTAALGTKAGTSAIPIPGATPGNAAGTDSWSGGSTWVGEQGPEVVNLPRGSQVIPNDALQANSGGDSYVHNDFRGAVVTDDLMRKSDAVKMSQLSEDRAYSRAVTASKEIALRSRPSR